MFKKSRLDTKQYEAMNEKILHVHNEHFVILYLTMSERNVFNSHALTVELLRFSSQLGDSINVFQAPIKCQGHRFVLSDLVS